jgi:hypothetical protein
MRWTVTAIPNEPKKNQQRDMHYNFRLPQRHRTSTNVRGIMDLHVKLPDFLIIGAQKAGTTSLHHYCRQHPDICMSRVKEPMFFSSTTPPKFTFKEQTTKTPYPFFYLNEYTDLFKKAVESKPIRPSFLSRLNPPAPAASASLLLGEASTAYLANPSPSCIWIRKIIPDVKLIAILRNPIQRAVSAYKMYSKRGVDLRSLEEVMEFGLNGRETSIGQGQQYLTLGLYAKQLTPFLKMFPKEQFFIGDYDEYDRDNLGFLQKVFAFLQVKPFTPKDLKRLNVTETNRTSGLDKPLEEKVKAFFEADILALKNMVDFDVQKWLL